MQQARSLWTLQKYGDCLELLSELRREFPQEEEILRLLETVREDQAEQHRRQTLEKVRTLLAAGRHEECTVLLREIQSQFPADDEIARLLDDVHQDQRNQGRLQGLAQARRLLAGRQYEQCVALLMSLQAEFPAEEEFGNLLQAARSRGRTSAQAATDRKGSPALGRSALPGMQCPAGGPSTTVSQR